MELDLMIRDGILVDPVKGTEERLNLGILGDKIAFIGHGEPGAKKVLEAFDLLVSPGFVDTHMHDEELDDPGTIQRALLRQGVTTALAGNCGSGPSLERVKEKRKAPWLNLGYLSGHRALREEVGIRDVYQPATEDEIVRMEKLLRNELELGVFGLSFGLEYAPNTSPREIEALCRVLDGCPKRFVSVHIRHDGPDCLESVAEVIGIAERFGIRVQVSHLGSMTAFGYTARSIELIEEARARGVDVTFDCYPYSAFCTFIGSTVFDPGFEERWGKGLESLEAASGRHRGKRLTPEIYDDMRKNDPQALIIAHVMNEDEIRLCLKNPRCAIASDGVLHNGEGHPRAAGAFPRALRWLREEGLSWAEAIRHATSLPAEMAWLPVGRLEVGAPADLVLFSPDDLRDRATFEDQLAAPEGIAAVVVNGKIAVEHGEIAPQPAGRLLLSRSSD
jgi:N-acyl-D-amino-acid deacylase